MPDTVPQRPIVPLNFVSIRDAAHRLGVAKYGNDWQTILAERGEAFDVILRTLGEAGEAGTVAAVYEWSAGDLQQLERAAWHVPDWRHHILSGRITITQARDPHSFWEPPLLEKKFCWIFVRAADIAQLEAKLKRSSRSSSTKPKGKPTKPSKRTPATTTELRGPGRIPEKQRKIIKAMQAAIDKKDLTIDGLKSMKQTTMQERFGASRKTCKDARDHLLKCKSNIS